MYNKLVVLQMKKSYSFQQLYCQCRCCVYCVCPIFSLTPDSETLVKGRVGIFGEASNSKLALKAQDPTLPENYSPKQGYYSLEFLNVFYFSIVLKFAKKFSFLFH